MRWGAGVESELADILASLKHSHSGEVVQGLCMKGRRQGLADLPLVVGNRRIENHPELAVVRAGLVVVVESIALPELLGFLAVSPVDRRGLECRL